MSIEQIAKLTPFKAAENTHDWAKKERFIVDCCFSNTPQSAKLAILILLYLSEDLNYVLMGTALQAKYRQSNQRDALKSKPLQIIHIHTVRQHGQLTKTLRVWEKIVEAEKGKLREIAKEVAYVDEALSEKMALWNDYCTVLTSIGLSDYTSCAVVINEQSIIEGVICSKPSSLTASAYYISYLLTAPWNLIQGKKSVTGAGSALIEYVALQSLKRQGIDPEDQLPSFLLKRAAVILTSTPTACSFYAHLFFVEQPNSYTKLILTGKNMLQFFEHFGGRASYAEVLI